MAWLNPTGYTDPDSIWNTEAYAYDGNLGTEAFDDVYNHYLELTHASIQCSKVQIYATAWKIVSPYNQSNPNIDIDVYYAGAWHNIHSGAVTRNTWIEKTIGSIQAVTAARIKGNASAYSVYIIEFQFYEEAGAVSKSSGYIIG